MQIDEQTQRDRQPKTGQKPKSKHILLKTVLLVLVILIIIATLIMILMLQKPDAYTPPEIIQDRQVSKYITHVIGQEIYNGAQLGKPFEVVIDQVGIKDIVARSDWPKQYGRALLNAPSVRLEPGLIVMEGFIQLDGVELFVLLEGGGYINPEGLMNVQAAKVKVGAVNITAAAKLIAGAIYSSRIKEKPMSPDDYRAKIYNSLFYNIPFDPIFEVDNRNIRISEIKIAPEKLTLSFVPAE